MLNDFNTASLIHMVDNIIAQGLKPNIKLGSVPLKFTQANGGPKLSLLIRTNPNTRSTSHSVFKACSFTTTMWCRVWISSLLPKLTPSRPPSRRCCAIRDYAVELLYTCPPADVGATVELSLNGQRLAGKVDVGWDPPLNTNQDTLPRPAIITQLKPFRPLALGTIRLAARRGALTLRALEIPGATVMDLRGITLTLRRPQS
ncbi:MAG: hypothetical protein ACREIA_19155 [Opitutaceae bacterium]